MATAVLGAAGGAIGAAVGSSIGGTLLTFSATAVGRAVGAAVGQAAGAAIDAGGGDTVQVGKLTNQQVMNSREGTPINRVWGRARVAGTMIWWANFTESVTKEKQGGKGGGGGTTTKTYRYSLSFAVALCEGPVQDIGQIWVNGRKLDESQVTLRRYLGTEDQQPDPTIQAVDGADNVPGYRGVAYLVFEDMPLEEYGNRPPQVSAEVVRATDPLPIRGACLIPGSTEFGYDTVEQTAEVGTTGAVSVASNPPVSWETINVHQREGRADVLVSLDQLETALPDVETVLVVVGWFFDDLRCGETAIEPRVEFADKDVSPGTWRVSGITRQQATVVSTSGGAPAYGSSPDDLSVFRLLQELKARGKKVIVYPFLFGDIDANSLPNPYSDNAAQTGQPVFPWRGRITSSVAPGYAGSPDKTSAAAAEVGAFFGAAEPGDFGAWDGATVPYSGPANGGLRRMILHYAHLAAAAGLGAGDSFAIGSEMVGLNRIRSDSSTFPAVAEWRSLAADVRGILPSDMEITYASDWSETAFFTADDGTGDFFHHLDPLWADPNIDYVAIDNYLPLADINPTAPDPDGDDDERWKQYDIDYLRSQVEGGELWDYFYASAADRAARVRTPITDGEAGKDWVFRRKALRDWWSNEHYDRPGGAEEGTPTAWTPESKRIVFTEYGFPAVDLGANQPNVFYDPKSSESFLPYFSSGLRDDAAQAQGIRALIGYWQDNMPTAADGSPMIDLSLCCAWAWDARPYPAFPDLEDVWADGPNYQLGHWLNGRAGAFTVGRLLQAVAADYGISLSADAEHGTVTGYVIEDTVSYRDAVAPILDAWAVDMIDTGVGLRVQSRIAQPVRGTVGLHDLAVIDGASSRFERSRQREEDLPAIVQVRFACSESEDYDTAAVSSVRRSGGAGRVTLDLPVTLAEHEGFIVAERLLREVHAQREALTGAALPPSMLSYEAGDLLRVTDAGRSAVWQVTRATGDLTRELEARKIDRAVLGAAYTVPGRTSACGAYIPASGTPAVTLIPLDLPQLDTTVPAHQGYAAVFASPWPGAVDIFRSAQETSGYTVQATALLPATIGSTLTDLPAGPVGRWHRTTLRVQIADGSLGTASRLDVLAGANAIALETPAGWEIVQFEDATLVSPNVYDLSMLLRGRLGTENRVQANLAAGAGFVVLNEAILALPGDESDVNQPFWWKLVRSGDDLSSTSFQPYQFTFTGAGLRPWAPAHVRGRRNAAGDLTISWMRRSRAGSSWGAARAPLAEETEAYEVDILDGGNVVRTIETGSESATYPEADQIADFGSAQAQVDVVVYQIGTTYGRGAGRAATV